jgi:hypothetical protein
MSATPMNLRKEDSISICFYECTLRLFQVTFAAGEASRRVRIATEDSGVEAGEEVDALLSAHGTYFLNIPKNIRSFEVSSGGFSATAVGVTDDDSEAVDGAVEAGEASKEPEDVEAMVKYSSYKINRL